MEVSKHSLLQNIYNLFKVKLNRFRLEEANRVQKAQTELYMNSESTQLCTADSRWVWNRECWGRKQKLWKGLERLVLQHNI